jgi:hypothetical protein
MAGSPVQELQNKNEYRLAYTVLQPCIQRQKAMREANNWHFLSNN